ncbi:MAG: pyridoxamine 5'-phosphate oxidase [Pseudomonadota bacterium]
MSDDNDELIPATPTAEEYEAEAKAQAGFAAEDDQGDVFGEEADPMALFKTWFALASEHEINDSNAMTLATVDRDGHPDARVVLLKDVADGFTFYSNKESAKGVQLQQNPAATLLFHWKTIRRQVRIHGDVVVLSDDEADAYFAKRDRGSQVGAWASQQSREMTGSSILNTRIADYEELFAGRDVPRPPFWLGYKLVPKSVEFWVNRPFRLHDRRLFIRGEDGAWSTSQLYP